MLSMPRRPSAKDKLLDASLSLIREKGYAAMRVDELCERAGVTKGAFFHHFKSKSELGVAAAEHWSSITGGLFASAPYHAPADALDRVLGYIDFRRELIAGSAAEYSCVVGTMVQEMFELEPEIRDACAASIFGHASTLVADIEEAMAERGMDTAGAMSLAVHTQAVLQGAFILAKAKDDVAVARSSVEHLRRYVELLFEGGVTKEAA